MNISEELNQYLILMLGKEKIENADIDTITNLSLIFDKKNGVQYDLKDLMYFSNLEELTIKGTEINNLEMNCINRVDTLKEVNFVECKFKAKCNLCNNIEEVTIQNCKNFKKKYVSELDFLKNLKIEK